jgi:acylphosphatase
VRNLENGDVEIHAEGDRPAMDTFRVELERGPEYSRVTQVIEETAPAGGRHSSFEIRG